jgi:hypothetical protein
MNKTITEQDTLRNIHYQAKKIEEIEIQLDGYTWVDSRYELPESAYGSHAAPEPVLAVQLFLLPL